MRVERILLVVLLVSLASPTFSSVGAALGQSPCNGADVQTAVWENSKPKLKLIYKFQFSEKERRYCVEVSNKGGYEMASSFTAIVDGRPTSPRMPMLQPGESISVTKNVTEHLNASQDNHTVVLEAYGNGTRYTFTQRSTPDNSTIPSPLITDVEVLRYESNDSTALRVETFNPSKRGYAFSVQVETFGTDGNFDIAAPQENETSTVILPLEESADDVVAGKVRIFGEFGDPNTKFDQKEFISEAGNGTNYWDAEFERVPSRVDKYSYSNHTARVKYQGYNENLLSPLQKQIGAVATVLLIVGAVWWRHRRKYR